MSKPSENIESQRRKPPGVPLNSKIFESILNIEHKLFDHGCKHRKEKSVVYHFRIFSRDGDERSIWEHGSKPGILVVHGPRFSDEIDPDRPETFEFLELFTDDVRLIEATENESVDNLIKTIIKEARAEIRRCSQPPPRPCMLGLG